MLGTIAVGTAGWNIPRQFAGAFPASGSALERYGTTFNAAEINSTFYRLHRPATYARWAASVPQGFRFSVKVPRTVTHERRLVGTEGLLDTFVAELVPLGGTLGPLLVQLPPSFAFAPDTVAAFFAALRARCEAPLVCEPRHASWFTEDADAVLSAARVARVAADPPPVPAAAVPGGWRGLAYHRLHGSPVMYRSPYSSEAIAALARTLAEDAKRGVPGWCIFDNTMTGAALGNALDVLARLSGSAPEPT